MRRLLSLICLVCLCGCATMGRRVSEGQMVSFVPGHTTYVEVVAQLGLPTNEIRNPDGTRVIEYAYRHDRVNPEAVIPGVGMFFKERTSEHALTMIYFDSEGRYLSYSQQQGATQYGRGPFVGGPQ